MFTKSNHPNYSPTTAAMESDDFPPINSSITAEIPTPEAPSSSTASAQEISSLRLLGLLLQCAECVASDNFPDAIDLLLEISELASPFGSSPERVAAYFADALRTRVIASCLTGPTALSHCPPLPNNHHQFSRSRTLTLARTQKLHAALQSYNSLTPLVKFSHFTANQAIYEAVDADDRIHLIDLDVMQGLQWPGLFHILATRPRPVSSLRLTGIGSSGELLAQTGRRLAEFAASVGIPFEFKAVEGKIGELAADAAPGKLGLRNGEAIVVHWIRHGLYDVLGSDVAAMDLVRAMRPKVVTVVEQELLVRRSGTGTGTASFLEGFVDALHYYSAMFDALEDGDGGRGDGGGERRSLDRHQVESQLFGWEIKNILGLGGPRKDLTIESWADELMRVGFRPISLGGGPAAQASMLLGMFPWNWGGYSLVAEENGRLKIGWKDLPLLTASAWQPSDSDDIVVAAQLS